MCHVCNPSCTRRCWPRPRQSPVQCPYCARFNLNTAQTCRHCGTELLFSVIPVNTTEITCLFTDRLCNNPCALASVACKTGIGKCPGRELK